MKTFKIISVLLLCFALMFTTACNSKKPDSNGLVEGSIDITTENQPKIAVVEHYSYLGNSLAATLLRTDSTTNLGTAESPKTVTDFVAKHTTTKECYQALIDGKCDIVVGFEPDTATTDELSKSGITLKTLTLGTEELVFFQGPDCGVSTLTKEQMLSIMNGTVTNWKSLGGAKLNISAFLPDSDSFEYIWFTSEFGNLDSTPQPPVDIYSSADGIFTAIANYNNRSGAIGFSLRSDFSNTTIGGTKTVISITDNEGTPLAFTKSIVIAVRNDLTPDSVTSLVFNWLESDQGKGFIAQLSKEISK